jgi:hypothetical protein
MTASQPSNSSSTAWKLSFLENIPSATRLRRLDSQRITSADEIRLFNSAA